MISRNYINMSKTGGVEAIEHKLGKVAYIEAQGLTCKADPYQAKDVS